MNEVVTNRVIKISGKEMAAEVRAHLKTTFPGVKFGVRTLSFTGGSSIEVEQFTDAIYRADVEEALTMFTAVYQEENVSDEEYFNGMNGWRKIQYVRVEADGSLTPYEYASSIAIWGASREVLEWSQKKEGSR
jgi:Large polyvalent protein associated domain 29